MTRPPKLDHAPVLVVGAGIMGCGIAQVAAQAGHAVQLFDTRDGAAPKARSKLAATFDALVIKGKLTATAAQATLERITPITALEQAGAAQLVVEAIIEDLEAKRTLLRQLEAIVGTECVLATNTSSISITALANGMVHPGRLVGMHFFNPVPLMKLVEVVAGLHTEPAVAEAVFALCPSWGKSPVHARSTPGFIVNRIARPFYAEPLAMLQERAATPQVLDACLRAAGFRMGPCELMDLIGHDTNFAVTQSVYAANFFDKRYVPSLVQRELVDGGLLGRKSGRGFYRYPEGTPPLDVAPCETLLPPIAVGVHGDGPITDFLEQRLGTAQHLTRQRGCGWTGVTIDGARLVLTDGRSAQTMAAVLDCPDVAVFDRPPRLPPSEAMALAYAVSDSASRRWYGQAPAWLAALGFAPCLISDIPGLVVARTVSMVINEAADAVLQGVCTSEGADDAMKLGLNYPAGPFEWLAHWGVADVVALLDALDTHYRGERYRVSPLLRRQTRHRSDPSEENTR